MISECSIDGCSNNLYAEGVCFFHYPLWEAWGYSGGYEVYQFKGREEGRKQFKAYLEGLDHQKIIDILAAQDYKLAHAVIKTYADIPSKEDT